MADGRNFKQMVEKGLVPALKLSDGIDLVNYVEKEYSNNTKETDEQLRKKGIMSAYDTLNTDDPDVYYEDINMISDENGNDLGSWVSSHVSNERNTYNSLDPHGSVLYKRNEIGKAIDELSKPRASWEEDKPRMVSVNSPYTQGVAFPQGTTILNNRYTVPYFSGEKPTVNNNGEVDFLPPGWKKIK